MASAVLVSGIDVTDRVMEFGRDSQSLNDVEVVFTDQVTEIGGTVVEKGREPLDPADVSVLAFRPIASSGICRAVMFVRSIPGRTHRFRSPALRQANISSLPSRHRPTPANGRIRGFSNGCHHKRSAYGWREASIRR
jgi:hypothetical protein